MKGDIDAYSVLYKEYYRKLYNYGHKFSNDTGLVEDSIQEIFFDLWSRKDKLKNIEALNSYLYSSFRYIVIKKMKEQRKLALGEEETKDENIEFSIENVIIEREQTTLDKKRLENAFRHLTSRQYEVIFLRYYEKLSYPEVAAILRISVKATYKIMARSLAALKDNIRLFLLLC